MTTLTNSLDLSSLFAVVATHFDLVCCFILEAAVFFFQACSRHHKRIFHLTYQIDRERVDPLAALVFVSGCREVEYCTFSSTV